MKEKVYLVCKSKRCYGNTLGYNTETKEYIYYHFGKEIERWHGDDALLNISNEIRNTDPYNGQVIDNRPEAVKAWNELHTKESNNKDYKHYSELTEKMLKEEL